MKSQPQRPIARFLGQGLGVRWAMVLGGFLWIVFGYFRFITPQGPDVLWRQDLGYSVILNTGLFVLYNVPGVLALLLTAWAALSLLPTTQTSGRALKRAAWILLLLAAFFGLVATAGQIILFDPLTTGGLSFGTLFLGLGLCFAGWAAARKGGSSGEYPGFLGAGLMVLGVIGVATLVLRPLMFALALLPVAFGTAAHALFGLVWIALGLNLGNHLGQAGPESDNRATELHRGWFPTLWFLATAAGVVLCGFLFHFPGALPPSNGETFNLNPVGALVNGLATGAVVGGLQAWLLRRSGLGAWRWQAGSAAALFLSHAFGDMLPDSVALPLMVVLGGLLLGLAQWWAAAWPVRVGLVWTAVTGISWAAALWAGYQAGYTQGDWRAEHLIVAAAVGTGVGACTAATWLWPPVFGTARRAIPKVTGRDHAGAPAA